MIHIYARQALSSWTISAGREIVFVLLWACGLRPARGREQGSHYSSPSPVFCLPSLQFLARAPKATGKTISASAHSQLGGEDCHANYGSCQSLEHPYSSNHPHSPIYVHICIPTPELWQGGGGGGGCVTKQHCLPAEGGLSYYSPAYPLFFCSVYI